MIGTPRISIGIPVYNGENYIKDCIDSILAQTFEDFEIIISDNASTDGTQEICERYAELDPRIKYYRAKTNRGAFPNFNRAFELSCAPYFKWACHDDVLREDFLESCLEVLEKDREIVVCHARELFINGKGETYHYDRSTGIFTDPGSGFRTLGDPPHIGEERDQLERFHEVLHESPWSFHFHGLMRRDALLKTSLLRNYFGSDATLLVELILLGRFHTIDDQLYLKRLHPQMSHVLPKSERAAFIDTSSKIISGRLAQLNGYLNAVWSSPTSFSTRTILTIAIFRHGIRSWLKWRRIDRAGKSVTALLLALQFFPI